MIVSYEIQHTAISLNEVIKHAVFAVETVRANAQLGH